MGRPILAVLNLVRLRHGRALAVLEGWFLVLMMVGGGIGIGYSLGGVRADYVLANQALERNAEIGRMQDTNLKLLAIIQDRLPAVTSSAAQAADKADRAADKVDRAAEAAEGAIKAAKGAATKAGTAATKATAAAKSASTAVKKVEEVLTPPPPAPARVPEWLNTP